jgi:hypothetical protein
MQPDQVLDPVRRRLQMAEENGGFALDPEAVGGGVFCSLHDEWPSGRRDTS